MIIILGAGLTGLSCAYHLQRDYLVLEKEDTPGGLCRSLTIDGFTFDYTGHLLHLHQPYTEKLISQFLKGNLKKIRRNSCIYFRKRCIPYPFQANLWALPEKIKKECLKELSHSPLTTHHLPVSFYDWCLHTYGRGISKYFFFPYNHKIWLHPLQQITTEWVNPFIPSLTKRELIAGARKKPTRPLGYNAYFYYPKKGGIQSLIDVFVEKVANIHLNSEVKKINWKKGIVLTNDEKIEYKYLISTLPLPEFLARLENPPEEIIRAKDKLSWTSVSCINLGIKNYKSAICNLQSAISKNYHWIYFPEKDFLFYRVGCYSNFSSQMVPTNCSSLYVEIAHRPDDKLNLDELTNRVREGLRHCGIIQEKDKVIVTNILSIPYAYVVYNQKRTEALEVIRKFLRQNSIFSIGRYGAWKYSFMEESILDGKSTAEELNKAVIGNR